MFALVNFKEVYTVRTLQMVVQSQITVNEFMNESRGLLGTHFGINEDDVEIVESGKNTTEYASECAPALMPSESKLYDIWGASLYNLAFYIRRKNQVHPPANITAPIGDHRQIPVQTNVCVDECPICLEPGDLIRRYSCSHGICNRCYVGCQISSIRNCSLCRSY